MRDRDHVIDRLKDLGLPFATPGEVVELSIRESPDQCGAPSAEVGAALVVALSLPGGIELEHDGASRVHAYVTDGAPLTILASRGPVRLGEGDEPASMESRSSLDLFLGDDSEVVFTTPEGCGIFVERGERFRAYPFELDPVLSPSPPGIESPAAAWCEELPEGWVKDHVREHTATSDALSQAIAVGAYRRYLSSTWDRDAREAAIADLRAGREIAAIARADSWARSLTEAQVGAIERLAAAEVTWLLDVLDDLRAAESVGIPAWRDQLRELCIARDDLDALRRLMALRGAADRLVSVLEVLDRVAAPFVSTLPAECTLADPQLLEAARQDDSSWWVAAVEADRG